MLKNSLFQPSLSFSFSAAVLFLFLFLPFSVSALPPFVSLSFCLSFLFNSRVPFFSAQKTFFSAQNNSLFNPKTFFSAQTFLPKRFSVFFSPNVFASAQNLFQFSPHHCFSFFLFCFSLFSFCWFCFQLTFSFSSAPPFLLSFSAPHSLFLANFQGQKYSL